MINRMCRGLLATLVLLLALGYTPPALADDPGIQVVARELNNPHGLNFGPEGVLYVTEAGSGGSGACAPHPWGGLRCYGASGSITRINLSTGSRERVATGLPSLATPAGMFAVGVYDISFHGRGNGYFVTGYAANANTRGIFGPEALEGLAHLGRMVAGGNWNMVSDLGGYEAAHDPNNDLPETNPNSVLALPGKQIVVDAAANDLLEIRNNGDVRVLAVFPSRMVTAPPFMGLPPGTQVPAQAVPTSVVLGPDGYYYVGQLTGFPFPIEEANVYRVPRHGGTPQVVATGFTCINDIAFGPDGSLYVLEIARHGVRAGLVENDWAGALIRVAPDGSRSEIAAGALFAPAGIAIDNDGVLYVTNNSIYSGTGEVLRIQP